MHFAVGPFDRIDDLQGALVQDRMVIGFHADSDDFGGAGHGLEWVDGSGCSFDLICGESDKKARGGFVACFSVAGLATVPIGQSGKM